MRAPAQPFLRDPRSSTVHLAAGPWTTVLEALCARFPHIPPEQWRDRVVRGRVLDADGRAIDAQTVVRDGMRVHYFREVADEVRLPFEETVLHRDEHLLVVDKPHFLPVMPAGAYVEETLLRRLIRRLDLPMLAPLHRIDRTTAGLVMFSVNRASCAAYLDLFRERRIEKRYEALAAPLPEHEFPMWRRTRLVTGEPFFRMCEVDGEPNSETRIEVLARHATHWHYALYPRTGRKHQLRVHMAAWGAPILHDPWYPQLGDLTDDWQRPLQLLAQGLAFIDPMTGEARRFESGLRLQVPATV